MELFKKKPQVVELDKKKEIYWIKFYNKRQIKRHLRTLLYCSILSKDIMVTYFDKKQRITGRLIHEPVKLNDETIVMYLQKVA